MAHTVNRIPEPLIAELEQAFTLPSNFYVDPSLLEEEKRRIFWRSWQIVGGSEQAASPGDYFMMDQSDCLKDSEGNEMVVVRETHAVAMVEIDA